MIALPVFQMLLQPLDSGELGLVFSEEVEEFVQPAYVIPFKYKDRYWWHYPFYMPGEINGDYADFSLRAETTSSMLYLESDHFSEGVRFQVGGLMVQEYEIFTRSLFDPETTFDYVGMHGDLIKPFSRFVIICPIDLIMMDNLFKRKGACFVGLTPVFGLRRNYE